MRRLEKLVALAMMAVLLGLFALGVDSESGASARLSSPSPDSVASIHHEIFIGQPDKPVLILCEEKHDSLEVQRNCQLAIEALTDAGIQAVLLAEGTRPGEVPLSVIFTLGVPGFRLAVAEAQFKLGWLSGIEMAALQDPSLPLFGVEEPDSPERRAHREALIDEYWAWHYFCKELDSLLGKLSDQLSLNCEEQGAQWLQLPQELEPQFPQIATALERAQRAEAALEQPVAGALPLEEAVATLQQEIDRGKPIREALITLQRDFSGARTTFSARFAEWGDALDSLYDAIIETAQQAGLDVSRAEELRETYRQRSAEAETALSTRHGPMISNAEQALYSVAFEVGILKIGAGHTAQLKELLREQGISYLVVTPNPSSLRLFTTPQRESNWYQRIRRGEKMPLESWLGLSYAQPLILADPDKRKALATDIALVRAIYRALRGETPGVPAGLLIKSFQARSIPEGVEITVEGISGRRLLLQFPSDFELTATAAEQLVRHLIETLEGQTWLIRRDDGFFSPATHLYLELLEEGFRGGAFITYLPEEDILFTRAVTFEPPVSIEGMVNSYKEMMEESLHDLALNPERVRNRQPTDLFAPLTILDPIVETLDAVLEDLGLPEDQIIPIALRLAPLGEQNVSSLREVNFTLLATLARLAGVEGYERRLIFVKSGLEADSDWIRVGGWERLLANLLQNIHRWAPTVKHIAVVTVPTTDDKGEWESNPYADYLRRLGWTFPRYRDNVLPYVQRALNEIGLENVVEPLTQDDFFTQLEEKLQDVRDATITITLVAHRREGQPPVIHFKGERDVPLENVLEDLKRLQEEGRIPGSAKLEFNVLVCSIGKEGAEGFLKQLGARLVIASPYAIGLATNSVLLARLARKVREEDQPLYQAHFEAQEEILSEILEKSPAELDAEGIRSLEMPGPMARKTGGGGSNASTRWHS
jgi:hypothetical protein